jgi:hypothetical protein
MFDLKEEEEERTATTTADPSMITGELNCDHIHNVTSRFNMTNGDDDEDEQPITLSPSSSVDDRPVKARQSMNSFDDERLNKLYDDWLALDAELRVFEPKHKEYVRKLDDVESLKAKYKTEFDKYKKKVEHLQHDLVHLRKSHIKNGTCLDMFHRCRHERTLTVDDFDR